MPMLQSLVRPTVLSLGLLNVCMGVNLHSWSRNVETPVWQLLQQQLVSDMGQERMYQNSETVVPTTLIYLMSEYEKAILKPLRIQKERNDSTLNIHLIGATYLFEGLSDWNLLAEWMPKYIRTVRIDLILGSPFQEDGPSKDEQGHRIVMDVPDDMQGQVDSRLNVSLLQTRSLPRRKMSKKKKVHDKMDEQELRKKSCGSHLLGTKGVRVVVKCHEKLYQDVWDIIPKPNLAMMINPGFPLPNRRAFDGVLRHLLKKKIPTAVSAQQYVDGGKAHEVWSNGRTPGVKLVPKKDFADEVYQTFETLQMYEAQVVATSSPFPYVYTDGGDVLIKNNVLEFFVGRKPGATRIKMLRRMHEGQPLRHEHADHAIVAELANSLRTPVSRPYARAMKAWARSSMSKCKKSKTVQDWVSCCHVEPTEIEC